MSFKRLLHVLRVVVAWLILPALAVVIWGELKPADQFEIHVWDKLLHFTAYFGLSLMATIATRANWRAVSCALMLIILGGTLEIVQGMVGRDCDIWDEVANTIGVVTGLAAGWAGIAFLRARKLVEARPPD